MKAKFKYGNTIDRPRNEKVETGKGESFCWWIEIKMDQNRWVIELSVHKTEASGQHMIQRLPDRSSEVFENFSDELGAAVKQFGDSAMGFSFA